MTKGGNVGKTVIIFIRNHQTAGNRKVWEFNGKRYVTVFPMYALKIRNFMFFLSGMLCYAVCVHTVIAQIALCQFNVAADPFHTRLFFFVDPASPHQKKKVLCGKL